jgi:hypothetical protein
MPSPWLRFLAAKTPAVITTVDEYSQELPPLFYFALCSSEHFVRSHVHSVQPLMAFILLKDEWQRRDGASTGRML